MDKTINEINTSKVIAIVRLDDLSNAVKLTRALLSGGINVIEFTLTNPEAMQAISRVRDAVGNRAVIGAGSVITPLQVQQVAESGAQFVVSPVTKADVIEACHQYNLPAIPGAYTPTEILKAWEMDVTAVKVFPARDLGANYIKDVLAPLPQLRLIPTGGVNVQNVADFFLAGASGVGVGSALCNREAISSQDWDTLSKNAKQFREAIP